MRAKEALKILFKEFGEGKAVTCDETSSATKVIRLKGSKRAAILVWSYENDPTHCDSLAVHRKDPAEELPVRSTWFSDQPLCRIAIGSEGVEFRTTLLALSDPLAAIVLALATRAAKLIRSS